jgi:hypothetical protein
MIIWHKPNGGSWEIIADGSYPNSVAVDIVGLNFSSDVPDIYENNNTEAAAYQVPTTWTQDEFIFMSSTSNIHSVTADSNDYYKLELEAGYDYKVFVRVHDNYSSMTGMYTNDVVFSVHDGTSWSNFYDDGEMDSISIPNVLTNQDLLINVVPFFYNDLGSYDLEVYVSRVGVVSVAENAAFNLSLYPNPVSDLLTIDFNESTINEITLTTVQGQLIDKVANIQGNSYQLDLSNVAEGIYYVNLFDGVNIVTERVNVVK